MTVDYSYRIFINADRQKTWNAMTDPDKTALFFYGTRVTCEWVPGAQMTYHHADDNRLISTGQIVSIDAPNQYECLFHAQWDPALAAEGPVREIWKLTEINGMTELTVELFDAPPHSATYTDFATGFPYILSGLKSVVETGKGLPAPY